MGTKALTLSLLFTAALPAQVPYGHFLVTAKQTAAGNDPTGAWFVDPTTGDVTPVLGLTTGSPRLTDMLTASIDPSTQDLIVKNDLLQGFSLQVYRLPMQGRVAQTRTNINYSVNGKITDLVVHPSGNVLMVFGGTGANAGLWSGPLAGGTNTALVRAIDSLKVAADASFAYLLTRSAGSSDIWRYVFSNNSFTRVAQSLPESSAIEIYPASPLLLVGTVSGDLLRVDASSGQFSVLVQVNRGPISGIRFNVRTAAVIGVTETGSVFDLAGNLVASIPRSLSDVDTGVTDVPAFFTFGDGCPGSSSQVPAMAATGLPGLGNATFAMTMTQGPASSVGLFALGNGRKDWFGVPLPLDVGPFGAPGCSILVNAFFFNGVALSGSGAGSLTLPIPNDPSLRGATPVGQWWVSDRPANPLGISFSDGGEAVIR